MQEEAGSVDTKQDWCAKQLVFINDALGGMSRVLHVRLIRAVGCWMDMDLGAGLDFPLKASIL